MGTSHRIATERSHTTARRIRSGRPIHLIIAFALAVTASALGTASASAGSDFVMRVPVLMYHRISCAPSNATNPGLYVCPRTFRSHLARLKSKGWTSVTADALARAFDARQRLGAKRFVITIDDGARDGYTEAFPILEDLDMVATFYVPAGGADCCQGHIHWDELVEMHDAGQDIANHSMDHDNLVGASDLVHEIEMSQRLFQREMGYRPTTFCYPYGSNDAAARAQVRASGFILAFTTVSGARESTSSPFQAKRLRVSAGEGPRAVLAKVRPYASGD